MAYETIIHLETMWKPGLSSIKNGTWSPTISVYPLLLGVSQEWGCKYIYRQVHNLENLRSWCKSASKARGLGKKYIWLSGHGGDKKAFKFHNEITPVEASADKVLDALELAGHIEGVIIDACAFGAHMQKIRRVLNNSRWILAAYKDIDWSGSLFIFVKAFEWLTESPKRNPVGRFKHGMETDNESKKKDFVEYKNLVKSMGIRLYYEHKRRGFSFYPGDSDV